MARRSPVSKVRLEIAQFEQAFALVAIEIGYVARAWNNLHETFGQIYGHVASESTDHTIAQAVWHSVLGDRNQRGMLSAALRAWSPRQKNFVAVVKIETEWLIAQTTEFSGKRNNALHGPLNVLRNVETEQFSVEPNYFWGNPIATKLRDKPILSEMRVYRSQIECLDNYATEIRFMFAHQLRLSEPSPPPTRPILPKEASPPAHKQKPLPRRPT